jgi:hypothetical protein
MVRFLMQMVVSLRKNSTGLSLNTGCLLGKTNKLIRDLICQEVLATVEESISTRQLEAVKVQVGRVKQAESEDKA